MTAQDPPQEPGIGVDARGAPVIDPTKNVLDLFEAGSKRTDDLRAMSKEVYETHIAYLEKIAEMREAFQDKLATKESGLRDSFRQLDREVGDKAAAAAQQAIATLAVNTTNLADTLRNQVASTAAAQEARRSADNAEIVKRLSALELSSSEGKGKGSVAEPQLERLASVVETLAKTQQMQGGKSQGISATTTAIIAAVGLVGSLFYISTQMKSAAITPQPIIIQVPSTAAPAPTTTTITAPAK